jgi:spore coat protein U-like protein
MRAKQTVQSASGGWVGWAPLLFLTLWGAAHAAPSLRLQVPSVDWRGKHGAGYDVFDPTPYSQTVDFLVSHSGPPCSYFVTFSKNTPAGRPRAMTSGGETLDYNLYARPSLNTVLKDLPSALPNEVISGRFGVDGAPQQRSFVFALPAWQIKRAGTYSDTVRVSLYSGTLTDHTLAQSVVIQLRARVPALVDVSLVAPGGGFDPLALNQWLDFGPLAGGKTHDFDLRVRSNAGYSVSLQSDNGGVLKSQEAGSTDSVPYQLVIGGSPTPLHGKSVSVLQRRAALTSPQGDGHSVRVIIGQLGNASPGNYRDVITVTVQADN